MILVRTGRTSLASRRLFHSIPLPPRHGCHGDLCTSGLMELPSTLHFHVDTHFPILAYGPFQDELPSWCIRRGHHGTCFTCGPHQKIVCCHSPATSLSQDCSPPQCNMGWLSCHPSWHHQASVKTDNIISLKTFHTVTHHKYTLSGGFQKLGRKPLST